MYHVFWAGLNTPCSVLVRVPLRDVTILYSLVRRWAPLPPGQMFNQLSHIQEARLCNACFIICSSKCITSPRHALRSDRLCVFAVDDSHVYRPRPGLITADRRSWEKCESSHFGLSANRMSSMYLELPCVSAIGTIGTVICSGSGSITGKDHNSCSRMWFVDRQRSAHGSSRDLTGVRRLQPDIRSKSELAWPRYWTEGSYLLMVLLLLVQRLRRLPNTAKETSSPQSDTHLAHDPSDRIGYLITTSAMADDASAHPNGGDRSSHGSDNAEIALAHIAGWFDTLDRDRPRESDWTEFDQVRARSAVSSDEYVITDEFHSGYCHIPSRDTGRVQPPKQRGRSVVIHVAALYHGRNPRHRSHRPSPHPALCAPTAWHRRGPRCRSTRERRTRF